MPSGGRPPRWFRDFFSDASTISDSSQSGGGSWGWVGGGLLYSIRLVHKGSIRPLKGFLKALQRPFEGL